MTDEGTAPRRSFKDRVRSYLNVVPWRLMAAVFRVLYDLRLEGEEYVPKQGPFIFAIHEPSLIGVFASGWLTIDILGRVVGPGTTKTMGFMQDQLFALSYFRNMVDRDSTTQFGALVPHSAGRMALSLVDGYRTLRDGGVITINPEGDGPWDGRPLPTGSAPAWLGLHSGAPIVPAICSLGAYDIWPRWGARPYLRGKLGITIGKPFKLADVPQTRVTPEDIEAGTARVRAAYDQIRYGPGGFDGWAGPPTRAEVPVTDIPELRPAGPVVPVPDGDEEPIPVGRRGIAQLLWRCPVCHTDDALVHKSPLLGAQTVGCLACATQWKIRHVPGKDFRLEVISGAPDLVGLDMALTAWYDEMKRDLQPAPIPVAGVDLQPAEEVYLDASGVSMVPHKPNPLFEDGWEGRDAPQEQPGHQQLGEWESFGEGRLLLTSQRIIWQGPDRELDFHWSQMTAVYLWLRNTLGIRYGTARYRLALGTELGLKWLTYAGTLASQAERDTGYELTLSPY